MCILFTLKDPQGENGGERGRKKKGRGSER